VNPEAIKEWHKVFRDFLIALVGAFMLIHETVGSGEPNLYIIAAGLAALGLPPALRLDERRKNNNNAK